MKTAAKLAIILILAACKKTEEPQTTPQTVPGQSPVAVSSNESTVPATQPAIPPQPVLAASPVSVPLISSNPGESFKDFAARFEAQIQNEFGAMFAGTNPLTPLPPKIDVRKTDSLLNPVVGILELPYKSGANNDSGVYIVKDSTFTFTVQDQKWVILSATGKSVGYDRYGNQLPPDDTSDLADSDRAAVDSAESSAFPDKDEAVKIAADIQR